MNKNLKLIINNQYKQIEEKQFFEKNELKIILDLYANTSGPLKTKQSLINLWMIVQQSPQTAKPIIDV